MARAYAGWVNDCNGSWPKHVATEVESATKQRFPRSPSLTGSPSPTVQLFLRWLAKATTGMTEFSLLDVGYGGGDLLRAIARWADKRGMRPFLWGIDLNPRSAETAREATPSWMNICYQTGDVFDTINARCPPVDFVVSTQFTHHLTDDGVVEFLRWAEANSLRGWRIADTPPKRPGYLRLPTGGRRDGLAPHHRKRRRHLHREGLSSPGMADLSGQGRFARGHRLAHGIPILREPDKAGEFVAPAPSTSMATLESCARGQSGDNGAVGGKCSSRQLARARIDRFSRRPRLVPGEVHRAIPVAA